MITLKGMTWDHPRGYDPLAALSRDWEAEHGVSITWDRRSLQDFESYPVLELAKSYDLIIIDHPHVGQITGEACLHPLPEAPEIAQGSLGRSFESYTWDGKQWAWPVDAAAQVQASRPDLVAPAKDWLGVMRLAREGKVMIPLRPPHVLMSFYTLCANLGHPCRVGPEGPFVDRDGGRPALEMLQALAQQVDPACFGMDPIAVLEAMADTDDIACSPLIYGYISYSLPDTARRRVTFHDIPEAAPGAGPRGSALGGTGLAVSAFSKHPDEAAAFARHAAGPEVQAGPWAEAGGQAGHRTAWTTPKTDAAAGHFYSGTLATLDAAWMRPRHDGYMPFQQEASERLNAALKDGGFEAAMDDLDRMFAATF
ncbi:extracellular solute-binding protein [Salipiger mucosus]|uniref:INTEGRAL MEMBRANE PROTEIN (Rhomboid family) n=1 Tax=Salipiger mucosus DSM 16094 TaxID=1123237 RepID=S9Q741_9RHOB|nr:extracellular solute-binding protein [Salipiger mucosus]EPX75857.1 INTEGRAL MEMBRANE PROTEIN (Rhomboid family) [Salipiger mucosus DSM 16094]